MKVGLKVRAPQIHESAQPSLKIKGGMTLNAKKHTETERRWSRDPAGLFIYCTLPEQAFWTLGCMCVCVCVWIAGTLTDSGSAYEWNEWLPKAVCYICLVVCLQSLSCVCVLCDVRCSEVLWGHSEGGQRFEGWPWNRLGGRVDKLEKIFCAQWKKRDLFSSFAHFPIILSRKGGGGCLTVVCSVNA